MVKTQSQQVQVPLMTFFDYHRDAFNVQVHHLREQVVEERELIGVRTENAFLFNLQNGEDGRQE